MQVGFANLVTFHEWNGLDSRLHVFDETMQSTHLIHNTPETSTFAIISSPDDHCLKLTLTIFTTTLS